MKILIAANYDVGLYQFRRELIAQLLSAGHQVTVSLPEGSLVGAIQEMGCDFVDAPVDRRGQNFVKDFKLLTYYRKILKAKKPELVITYTIKPNIYGGFMCRLLKIPYGVNITGLGTAFQKPGLLRSMVVRMYQTALEKAQVVFFENSANRQLFLDEKIVSADQTVLLKGAGVNLERYFLCSYPQGEKVRFLFLGRVMREKGIYELFQAMEQLHEEGHDCCLDVLGNYEEEDFQEIIRSKEEKGWLFYHGFQEDVRPFIEQAHCFVLPSYHEGMANTNLECASMGRPLITSNIPGCQEAVIDGKSGYLCEVKNADSLYAAMKKFLALSREQREAMGLAGRKHMEDTFDKKKVVAETMDGLGL